jgi:hypothetical protein
LEKIKKFKKRKAKNTAAIISGYKCAVEKIWVGVSELSMHFLHSIVKINREKHMVVEDEELEVSY